MKNINFKNMLALVLCVLALASCKKYYFDTGTHEEKYNGTVLQYMKDKKPYFDTTVNIIHLAGMDDVFEKENVTFFAPPSGSIYKSIKRLNQYLRNNGKDTVSQLSQINPSVWRAGLTQCLFRGNYLLKDYPQKDTTSYLAFPGQNYASYDGRIMNVGVIYNSAAGVAYAGYRQLFLSYIPDLSNPQVSLLNIPVATSNIQPTNGVIHVLNRVKYNFGFNTDTFIDQAVSAGIAAPTP